MTGSSWNDSTGHLGSILNAMILILPSEKETATVRREIPVDLVLRLKK